MAEGLARQGLAAGDRVALMLRSDRDFFDVFFGALYAGCIPVPFYPPARMSQIEDHLRRSAGILADARAAVLVTVPQAKPLLHLLRVQCESLRRIVTPADLSVTAALPPIARPAGDDTAFLQYTSGEHGRSQGSHTDACQSARQSEGDGACVARHGGRRVRILVAALP
ncbi:benzoate-CoA ligase family protein [compost metagenome]